MNDLEFTVAYLKAIEKKHNDYFNSVNLNIMKCVEITGTTLITVNVTQTDLPNNIRYDIEEMFWVH